MDQHKTQEHNADFNPDILFMGAGLADYIIFHQYFILIDDSLNINMCPGALLIKFIDDISPFISESV